MPGSCMRHAWDCTDREQTEGPSEPRVAKRGLEPHAKRSTLCSRQVWLCFLSQTVDNGPVPAPVQRYSWVPRGPPVRRYVQHLCRRAVPKALRADCRTSGTGTSPNLNPPSEERGVNKKKGRSEKPQSNPSTVDRKESIAGHRAPNISFSSMRCAKDGPRTGLARTRTHEHGYEQHVGDSFYTDRHGV